MNAFGFSVKGEHEDDSVDSENDDTDDDDDDDADGDDDDDDDDDDDGDDDDDEDDDDDDEDDDDDDRCVADSMTKVPVNDVILIAFIMVRFALAASEKRQVRELEDRTCTNRSGSIIRLFL